MPGTDEIPVVLATAVRRALRAPSVYNTQPWRWRLTSDKAELYADRDRQLGVVDPVGRLMVVSCGVALHHARVSLAAAGLIAAVDRLPDPTRPDLMARIRVTGAGVADPAGAALVAAIDHRRTDRRTYADESAPDPALSRLCEVAAAEGARLYVLRDAQIPWLAAAVARAGDLELTDPAYRDELIRWTNRPPWSGDGVPQNTAVRQTPRRVPVREFALGPADRLDPGAGRDRGASYAILFGSTDDPAGWLRGGEALSAVLLTAVVDGLSVAPYSDVVEVRATREALRGILAGIGHPYVVLRIGLRPSTSDLPATPRRDPVEVVDEAPSGTTTAPRPHQPTSTLTHHTGPSHPPQPTEPARPRGISRPAGRTRPTNSACPQGETRRQAPVPVVVVRPVFDGCRGPFAGHIVVGVDGSPPARAALELGFALAAAHRRPLAAVYVTARDHEDLWFDDVMLETHHVAEPAGLTLLAGQVEPWRHRYPTLGVKRALYGGRPLPGLLRAADGAHLLVVRDRGAGPATRALLGSVSHGAVDRACCPVAVAHTPSRLCVPHVREAAAS